MNKLYQIHIRDFLFKISPTAKLVDIPNSFWQDLSQKNITIVYLLGIWQICNDSKILSQKNYQNVGLNTVSQSQKTTQKIVGSCFAIDDYCVDTELGIEQDILNLKQTLNNLGISLVLDFIPNHFGVSSPLLNTNPNIFLQNDTHNNPNFDQQFYFEHNYIQFLYGKDPNFGSWSDTVQIDYSQPETHVFMTQKLEYIASLCDGVRCDMAMLIEPEIFNKTWSNLLQREIKIYQSFWNEAIANIKKTQANFIFIAEVYWDMEEQMLRSGFDFVYNKEFLDALIYQNFEELQNNLQTFKNPVYFLENHDEKRSITTINPSILELSAVLLCFLGGIQFFYDGQWQGETVRNPIQILDSTQSIPNLKIQNLYEKLLQYTNQNIFKLGQITFKHNIKYSDLITIIWEYQEAKTDTKTNLKRYIFINFGQDTKTIIETFECQYVEQKTYNNNCHKIQTKSKHIFDQNVSEYQNMLIEIPPKNWMIVECF